MSKYVSKVREDPGGAKQMIKNDKKFRMADFTMIMIYYLFFAQKKQGVMK